MRRTPPPQRQRDAMTKTPIVPANGEHMIVYAQVRPASLLPGAAASEHRAGRSNRACLVILLRPVEAHLSSDHITPKLIVGLDPASLWARSPSSTREPRNERSL
jgi:hypothetical protein